MEIGALDIFNQDLILKIRIGHQPIKMTDTKILYAYWSLIIENIPSKKIIFRDFREYLYLGVCIVGNHALAVIYTCLLYAFAFGSKITFFFFSEKSAFYRCHTRPLIPPSVCVTSFWTRLNYGCI